MRPAEAGPGIDVIGQPAIGLDHGASLMTEALSYHQQRQPGRQVGPGPAGADLPGHRLRPGSRPRASAIQVTGSVSTTFGGVPRVCRGPSMHCTAAYGGTRTSTARPGARRPAGRAGRSRRPAAPPAAAPRPRPAPRAPRTPLPAERRRLGRPGPGRLAQRGALLVHGGAQPLGIGAAGRHQPLTYRDPNHPDPGHRVDTRARWVTTYIVI